LLRDAGWRAVAAPRRYPYDCPAIDACGRRKNEEETMAWTTPTLVEMCIGLEINGYLPAEF